MPSFRPSQIRSIGSRLARAVASHPVYYGVLVAIVAGVLVKSVLISPRFDRWSFAAWYVEDYLLTRGEVPSCALVAETGNYQLFWNKICSRIHSPVHPLLTASATALTGIDFTGAWRRWFFLTPALKLLAGGLLASLYTRRRSLLAFGAVGFLLVPDYSAMYVTQAKGISVPVLFLGYYAVLRWGRDESRWFVAAATCLLVLSLAYFPRALILSTFLLLVALVRFRTAGWHPRRLFSAAVVVLGIVYLTSFGLLIAQLQRTWMELGVESVWATAQVLLGNLVGGTVESVPYAYTTPPYGAPILLTLALVGLAAGLSALRRERGGLLLDERVILLAAIVITYVPPSLATGFFYSRVMFEAGAPALLLAVGELDRLAATGRGSAGWPGRLGVNGRHLSLAVVLLLFASTMLILPPPGGEAYRTSEYPGLTEELATQGVGPDDPVFTDMRTGAYLVGEYQFRQVSHIVQGENRSLVAGIWYTSNATTTCRLLRDRYGAEFFIRNDVVHDSHLAVENYPRVPINRTAYRKYDRSDAFRRLGRSGSFTIYRISDACGPEVTA